MSPELNIEHVILFGMEDKEAEAEFITLLDRLGRSSVREEDLDLSFLLKRLAIPLFSPFKAPVLLSLPRSRASSSNPSIPPMPSAPREDARSKLSSTADIFWLKALSRMTNTNNL